MFCPFLQFSRKKMPFMYRERSSHISQLVKVCVRLTTVDCRLSYSNFNFCENEKVKNPPAAKSCFHSSRTNSFRLWLWRQKKKKSFWLWQKEKVEKFRTWREVTTPISISYVLYFNLLLLSNLFDSMNSVNAFGQQPLKPSWNCIWWVIVIKERKRIDDDYLHVPDLYST